MSTTFPTSLQDLDATRGTTGQPLNNPNHITHHTNEDDTIEALEAKVGIDGSAVTTSHDYKLSGVTGSDKAASLAGTETLTNKSLGSGTKVVLGSDATGDIYYRHSDGTLKRLAIGTSNYVLNVTGGVPAWRAETATTNASTTANGTVEIATDAELAAGTATGGTGAILVAAASSVGTAGTANKLVQYDGSGKYPAADGSNITNIRIPLFACGQTSRDAGAGTGTQNIAHGLGVTPRMIKVTATYVKTSASQTEGISVGTATSTSTDTCTYVISNPSGDGSAGQNSSAIISLTYTVADVSTLDATNITLNFSTHSTATVYIQWEAFY